MTHALNWLKQQTTVVADTGDVQAIQQLTPTDATTNPSLLLKAASLDQYQSLLQQAHQESQGDIVNACQRFGALVGKEILQIIPGLISTEVDARLSFDTSATIAYAKTLIELYKHYGIAHDRVLIKIAATYEGIMAAKMLEKEGIHTNVTLVFSPIQALLSAQNAVYLISPFVGRITDWFTKEQMVTTLDPGVASVKTIQHMYQQMSANTIVMAASFRKAEQVLALSDCGKITVPPDILSTLQNQKLTDFDYTPTPFQDMSVPAFTQQTIDESTFRWHLNEDAMATEKLAEGIRKFTIDQVKLEAIFQAL